MQQPVFAFIDEYGDPNLSTELPGTTDHYVIAAVMVEPAQHMELDAGVERVRKRHFQTGEIKSSKVGNNWIRRGRILDDLLELPFRVHLVVIHKDRIHRDSGLQFKRSFLKYIHGALYRRLFLSINDLRVIADEHGSREFMEGFREYVRRKHIPNLFQDADVWFENSRAQPLIQLADFIAGSVGHALRSGAGVPSNEILRRLGSHLLTFVEWPPVVRPFYTAATDPDRALDDLVREYSFNRAAAFIGENEDSDDFATQCQVEVLRYLHFFCQFIDEHEYVPAKRLLTVVESSGGGEISEHFFRSQVIAVLRDKGILIASSPSGYKIPVTVADMHRFVEQANQVIGPMLYRLNLARDALMTTSNGRLDILEAPELQHLVRRALQPHS